MKRRLMLAALVCICIPGVTLAAENAAPASQLELKPSLSMEQGGAGLYTDAGRLVG